MASLLHSHIVITDEKLRAEYDNYAKAINRTEVGVMGMTATQAGYSHGEEWLANVLEIVEDNYNYLKKELNEKVPGITVCALEGTYLVLLDMRKIVEPKLLKEFIQDKCNLAVDYGEWFGENFEGFVRLNLATDPKYVQMAVNNIIKCSHEIEIFQK